MDQYQEMIDEILEQPYTMEYCYHCGTKNQNVEENEVCENCGEIISLLVDEFNEKEKIFCYGCGSKLNESVDFCIACGRDKVCYQADILLYTAMFLVEEKKYDDALAIGKIAIDYHSNPYQKFWISNYIKAIYIDLLKNKFGYIDPDLPFEHTPISILKDDITKSMLEYTQIAIEEYDKLPQDQKLILEKKSSFSKMIQELRTVCHYLPIELAKHGLIENSSNPDTNQHKTQSNGCFIATALYGSYNTPEVLILRKFRDEILLTSKIGQIFVRIYYFLSPPFAGYLKKRNKLKGVIREKILTPFVEHISKKQNTKNS